MAANDRPPLISAVLAENIVECRRLIDTGEANVNGDRGLYGSTALHIASVEGHLEISELLTSSGADVNIRSSYGQTILHFASSFGYLEIVQLLLCQGADISFRNKYGSTALSYASSCGHLEVADCLRKWPCGHLEVADCLRKWPWTMAIIALKEDLAIYHLLDASTIIDLWQYLGNQ